MRSSILIFEQYHQLTNISRVGVYRAVAFLPAAPAVDEAAPTVLNPMPAASATLL